MTILNIAIPTSRRNSIFAPSAPGTSIPTTGALAGSQPHGLSMPDQLGRALSSLVTLEDHLNALASVPTSDREPAREHFAEALRRETKIRSTDPASSHSTPLIPDTFTFKLLVLARSDDVEAKRAVVTAVEEIMKATDGDAQLVVRLAMALVKVIPCPDYQLVRNTARLFASMTQAEGMSRLADVEISQAIEWLRDARSDKRRMCGIIVIDEMMLNPKCGALVADHAPKAIEGLWDYGLTAPKTDTREAARSALQACLQLLPAEYRGPHEVELLDDAIITMTSFAASPAALHGSVLTCCVLLDLREDMERELLIMWPAILKVKERDGTIGRAAMQFMASAARKSPLQFREHWLRPTFDWILLEMRREKMQVEAMKCLAAVLPAASFAASTYIESCLSNLSVQLLQAKHREAALSLVGACAETFKESFTLFATANLESFYSGGLSVPLVSAMRAVVEYIPFLAMLHQSRLLDCIAQTLAGCSYADVVFPSARPSHGRRASATSMQGLLAAPFDQPRKTSMERRRASSFLDRARGRSASHERENPNAVVLSAQGGSLDRVILALETLVDFDFGEQPMLTAFITHCVCPLVNGHIDVQVRKSAVAAVVGRVVQQSIASVEDYPEAELHTLLRTVLNAVVADTDTSVREHAILNLVPHLDYCLVEPQALQILLSALNDESLVVQHSLLQTLGRLMPAASAQIMPVLRNELTALVIQIEHIKQPSAKVAALDTLRRIIEAAPQLAELYSAPLANILLHGKWSDLDEAICMFRLLRVVMKAAGSALQSRALAFAHLAVSAIKDQSSASKRREAVSALTDIVANTVCMKDLAPYRDDTLKALVKHLASEDDPAAKRDVVRCLGMIGAAKPYEPATTQVEPDMVSTASRPGGPSTQDRLENGLIAFGQSEVWNRLPEWIADAVMIELLAIWDDEALKTLHFSVVDAVIRIFRWKTSRERSWHHKDAILGKLLARIADATLDMPATCFYISSLGYLAKEIGHEMEQHMGRIIPILVRRWEAGVDPPSCVVTCIHTLANTVRGCFRVALPIIFPKMASILSDETSGEHTVTAVLRFCQACAPLLKDWLHLAIPAIFAAANNNAAPSQLDMALETLVVLASQVYLVPHLSRILSSLSRLINDPNTKEAATRALCQIVKECGHDGLATAAAFESQLGFCIREHPEYRVHCPQVPMDVDAIHQTEDPIEGIRVRLKTEGVLAAFIPPEESGVVWAVWLQNLCTQMLRATPNHHLRTCEAIAEQHPPLQDKLVNYATYAAWLDLSRTDKSTVLKHIHLVLEMTGTGTAGAVKVQDLLLHLIDFMSRMGVEFPVSSSLCKRVAMSRNFLHRAMRYAELEYEDLNDPATLTDLLEIDSMFKTREVDHARGLQRLAQDDHAMGMNPRYLEDQDIDLWQAALVVYQEAAAQDATDGDAVHGMLRSLHALEQWSLMLDCVDETGHSADPDLLRTAGPLLAKAAWSLDRYDRMADIVCHLTGPDHDFYSAVLATVDNEWDTATNLLDKCRDDISGEITSVGATRTGRAYDCLVRTQLIMELEEAGHWKTHADERPLIHARWSARLDTIQKEHQVFQRYLSVHRLAIAPMDDGPAYIKMARTCRKNGRKDIALNAQQAAMGPTDFGPLDVLCQPEHEHTGLTLERCRLADAYGHRHRAIQGLKKLTSRIGDRLDALASVKAPNCETLVDVDYQKALLGRTMHTLGDYCRGDDMTSLTEAQICYERSIEFLPTVKGFRKLANTNLAIIELLETESASPPSDTIVPLAVSVIDAYVQMISKNSAWPLQDVLGLFTIATKYGTYREVADAAESAFQSLPIDCWMEAIPQLAAHLNYPDATLQRVLENHMIKLSSAHPHTMLATLASVARYPNKERAHVAKRLLNSMRAYQEELVEEALMLNAELIRVAATWEEVCLGGIERASAYLFGGEGKNPKGLVDALEAMCRGFEQPETADECEFVMKYAAPLRSARDLGRTMLKGGNTDRDLGRLWRRWHDLHRSFTASVKEKPSVFNLEEASPRLASARNLCFSVPGTYMRLAHEGPDISIVHVVPTIEVLSSKQRPRKLSVKGSDGRLYGFLLKPREDLRLDERCAQMFTLVNSLLRTDAEAAKRHLRCARFEVMPLNDRAGLIQWVARADTLQNVCRQERKVTGVAIDLELKAQVSHAPDLNKGTLSAMQQLECLELALDLTDGKELANVLWKKSSSAALWLERRTAYARSLATNSMVGHLLGLGDRHPSNLLQDRVTGELVQIDFGDAFEAAMERAQFPEKMPMRLTRQMIRCAGPTGIEGNFRICSELTMQILRDNKDAIEAVLEAFVRDPLIQHLVMNPREIDPESGRPAERNMPIDEHHYSPESRIKGRKAVSQLSSKAQRAIARAKAKLHGREFGTSESLKVDEQVERLIKQATDPYVLASAYQGWCAFW